MHAVFPDLPPAPYVYGFTTCWLAVTKTVCCVLCQPVLYCLCVCLLQGLEAILRVRCSSGLDVDGYVGSFYKPPNSPTDLYLPAVDCDKALVARLEIVEKLPANSEVCRRTCVLTQYVWGDGVLRPHTV